MNFQNMEYFLKVAECRSVTRAAVELGVSQQAISGQISRLEQELGCRLFSRRRGFELTSSGKCYLDAATRILDISREAESIIKDLNEDSKGELRIGISFSRGQAILPILLPVYHEMYPEVRLSVYEGNTAELENGIRTGDIDVLIGYAPFISECIVSRELIKEHIFLAVPDTGMYKELIESYREKHSLGIFRDCPFILLKGNERIRTLADTEFRKAGFSPYVLLETENIQTAFALSAEGMGISLCPEMYPVSRYTIAGAGDAELRNKVCLLPMSEKRYSDTIAIGWNGDRYKSRNVARFVELALNKIPSRAGSSLFL